LGGVSALESVYIPGFFLAMAQKAGRYAATGNTPEPTALAVPGSLTAYTTRNNNLAVKTLKTGYYLIVIAEAKGSSQNYFGRQ
jgi:hypothetical protein